MIDRNIFYARLAICRACEFWKGACLKGHVLQGSLGCPVRKFKGIEGAAYLLDMPVPIPEVPEPGQGGCCGAAEASGELKPMSWMEVWQHLVKSMQDWQRAGYKVVAAEDYVARLRVCRDCPKKQYRWFQCKHCKCVVYSKAKLTTEDCPYGLWPTLS